MVRDRVDKAPVGYTLEKLSKDMDHPYRRGQDDSRLYDVFFANQAQRLARKGTLFRTFRFNINI